jgi:hypothetical protein
MPAWPEVFPMAPSPVSMTQYGCSLSPYDWNCQPSSSE